MLLITAGMNAQVIFSEDFDNIPGSVSGGAGTYVFPAGWTLSNVDNRTPDASVSFIHNAWERREDFQNNVGDSVMFSTSYYTPSGQADDWAWTPMISLTSNCILSWDGRAYDAAYPDGYEVRIMTETATPGGPTGGTGVLGNQVTNSTVLFSTASESNTWNSHSVDLSAYSGENVWIAFRNNSTDQFLLVIDNIVVESVASYNAHLAAIESYEYTGSPISVGPEYALSGTVENNGATAITGVRLTADVYNSSNALVYTDTAGPVDIASGGSNLFTFTSFIPSVTDTFTIYYYTTLNETDGIPGDDSLMTQVLVTDSVYSRDNGIVTGNLGIGSGNGGYLGQQFTVNTGDTLTSVSMYFTRGYTGRRCAAVVWNMSGGYPDQIIAATDTIVYPDDSARTYTLPMYDLSVLTPGEYVITAIEFDSTLALGLTNDIFTLGKTWVDWPANPITPWGNNEDYGVTFSKSYALRANFGEVCHTTYFSQNVTLCYGETMTVGTNTYSVSGSYQDTLPNGYCDSIVTTNLTISSQIPVQTSLSSDFTTFSCTPVNGASYQWIDCPSGMPISGADSSSYTTSAVEQVSVVITLGNCSDTSACISNTGLGLDDPALSLIQVMPNPVADVLTIHSPNYGVLILWSALGQQMKYIRLNEDGSAMLDVSGLAHGVYYLSSEEGLGKVRFVVE